MQNLGECVAKNGAAFSDSSIEGAFRQLFPCNKYTPFTGRKLFTYIVEWFIFSMSYNVKNLPLFHT